VFALPLIRQRQREEGREAGGGLVELHERYRNALADIQDAETDWQIGNLSEADFSAARDHHRRIAAEALREITAISEARERIRAELEHEIATATRAPVATVEARKASSNGVHHDAPPAVVVARATTKRAIPAPLAIGLGTAIGAVVAIGFLYAHVASLQAAQAPLSTLPIAHAHTVALGDNGTIWIGHHNGLLRSENGRVWEAVPPPGDVMAIVRATASGMELALGHDVLLVRDRPTEAWRPLEHNLPGTDVHGADAGARALYAYLEGWGIFTTRDSHVWQMTGPPLREGVAGLATLPGADTDDIFVVSGGALLRSRDSGRTWAAASGAANMALSGVAQAVAADASNDLLYVGTSMGLYRSATHGSSWTELPFRGSVTALGVRSERIAVVDGEQRFFLSTDGGGTWTAQS
jgi:hypothetical protein